MSTLEEDAFMSCLFDRQDMKLVNIKFFRGVERVISTDEIRREAHSAIMQLKLDPDLASKEPPRSGCKEIDVASFVASL